MSAETVVRHGLLAIADEYPVCIVEHGDTKRLHDRCMVTTRAVPAGELLWRETPLAVVHAVQYGATDGADKARNGVMAQRCGFDPDAFIGGDSSQTAVLSVDAVPVTRAVADPVLCLVETALLRAPWLVTGQGARVERHWRRVLRNDCADRHVYATSIASVARALGQRYHVAKDKIVEFAGLVRANQCSVRTTWGGVRYGEALYGVASVINHACRANTTVSFHEGFAMEVRAAERIDAGVEVTRTYDAMSLYGVQCRAVLQRPGTPPPRNFQCTCRHCTAFRVLVRMQKIKPVACMVLDVDDRHEQVGAVSWPPPWQYMLIAPDADLATQLLALQALAQHNWSVDTQSLFLRCFDAAGDETTKFELGAQLVQCDDFDKAARAVPVMALPFVELIFYAALAVRTSHLVPKDDDDGNATDHDGAQKQKRDALILQTIERLVDWAQAARPLLPARLTEYRQRAFGAMSTWMQFVAHLLRFEKAFAVVGSSQAAIDKNDWQATFDRVAKVLPHAGASALRDYAQLLRYATAVRHEPHETAARLVLYELHTCALLKTFVILVDLAKSVCAASPLASCYDDEESAGGGTSAAEK